MMDIKSMIIVTLAVALFVVQNLRVSEARRTSFLEGREAVFTAMSEASDHVCGPYEQPVHPNFRKQ